MNNLSTQQLILGGNVMTTTGNNLYINGQAANISGITTPSISYITTVNWTSGNIFRVTLTGNVSFSFTGQQDGQTIVVAVTNNNNNGFSGTWPAAVSWPSNGTVPQQTSGNFTDIYTFVDVTGKIYGSVVQGFK